MSEKVLDLRYSIFAWRVNQKVMAKVMLSLMFAGVTGLLAGIRIPLPFTPIPITGQVLGVLLSGICLGSIYGGLSQIFYIGLGLCGIPWFNGWKAMTFYQFALSPTAGYLIGFVIAGFFLGYFADSKVKNRYFLSQMFSMFAAIIIILTCGTVYLGFLFKLSMSKAFVMGFLPFVIGDLTKAFIAAGISSAILPKLPYGSEK